MPFAVTGTADQIRTILCGPQQHNEHCKGYRWRQYIASMNLKERNANVMAAAQQIVAEHRAMREHDLQLQAAE